MLVARKLKAMLLLLLAAIRRCFCCFRMRKDSRQGLPIAVPGASGGRASSTEHSGYGADVSGGGWEEWDGPSSVVCDGGRKLTPVEQQILEYRQAQQRRLNEQQRLEPEEQQEQNLFEVEWSLVPSLPRKPQVVIYARPDDESGSGAVSNRTHGLTCTDALMQVGGDLGEWDEEGGEEQWDGEGEGVKDEEVDLILQQQRQLQRQQQRLAREARRQLRLQRDHQRGGAGRGEAGVGVGKLATKLS